MKILVDHLYAVKLSKDLRCYLFVKKGKTTGYGKLLKKALFFWSKNNLIDVLHKTRYSLRPMIWQMVNDKASLNKKKICRVLFFFAICPRTPPLLQAFHPPSERRVSSHLYSSFDQFFLFYVEFVIEACLILIFFNQCDTLLM